MCLKKKESDLLIGLIVQTSHHCYLYKSTIESLLNKNINVEIIINDFLKFQSEWEQMYLNLNTFVHDFYPNIKIEYLTKASNESKIYDCIISPFYIEEASKLSKYNIRMVYGLAKELWGYSWWNIYFDRICCYGYYDYKKLNIHNSAVIVGNAKFDNWFQKKIEDKKNLVNKFNLDVNKKNILYLPTYGELSSIDLWIDKIKELDTKYNVIIKMHHGTAYLKSEKLRKEKLLKEFKIVLDDRYDLADLINLCDYILTDSSGSVFDAILADKNVVILDIPIKENIINTTNKYSIEQTIKDKIIHINIDQSIYEVLQGSSIFLQQESVRKNLKNLLFKYNDGFSGERVVETIIGLLFNENKEGFNFFGSSLRQKILEQNLHISNLQDLNQSQENHLCECENSIKEKQEKLKLIEDKIEELYTKNDELIKEKNYNELRVNKLTNENNSIKKDVDNLNNELNIIYSSRLWKIGSFYYKLRDKVFKK